MAELGVFVGKSILKEVGRLELLLPYTSLKRIMKSGNPKMALLGIKAALKNLGRFKDFS